MPRVYIKTYGCQMNEYDSGKMRALLGKGDYVPTDEPTDADLIIVNTCAIREKPEQKLASFLGTVTPMKKSRPLTVAVSGCVAQLQGKFKLNTDVFRALFTESPEPKAAK